jgi:hypothetical protein
VIMGLVFAAGCSQLCEAVGGGSPVLYGITLMVYHNGTQFVAPQLLWAQKNTGYV